jgi:RNA polymerase sigma factor (sigma-70 family)
MTFEEIYVAHYKDNFNKLTKKLARRLGGRQELAQEALQDAYLKAWRYQRVFEDPAQFNKWMGTIINNAVRDKKKEEWRKESIRTETSEEVEIDVSKAYIAKAIKDSNISEDHKRVLSLRFEYDLPIKDIPHFTKYSYSTCRIIVSNFMKGMNE